MFPLLTPAPSAALAAGLFGALGAAAFAGRRGAKARAPRIALATLAGLDALAHLAWAAGPTHALRARGVEVTHVLAVTLLAAVASLPLALAARALAARAARRAPVTNVVPSPVRPSRRAFVQASFVLPPLGAAASAAATFATSNAAPELPLVRVALPDLPDALIGLTVLQLSDLHLGVERHACDVAALVARLRAAGLRPDLVALTGDVADVPGELPGLFEALRALDPVHGVVACFGNHEHLNGPEPFRRACQRAGAELLVDQGTLLRVRGERLWIGGVDDPRRLDGEVARALGDGTRRALAGAPGARGATTPRLLLSHRPEGVLPAAELGASLVLSGHTHGGQIGWGGRSAFERVFDGRYLWGDYVRGRTALYTSSGFGHWFPFRAGCPTEAPLVRLERAPQSSTRTSRITSPWSTASRGPSARPTHA